jgi:hypothetical protein
VSKKQIAAIGEIVSAVHAAKTGRHPQTAGRLQTASGIQRQGYRRHADVAGMSRIQGVYGTVNRALRNPNLFSGNGEAVANSIDGMRCKWKFSAASVLADSKLSALSMCI